ncbi:hypothetical protein BCR35DRAFT_298471 [Leucosporidium creatinivorum]|uniref:Uncharacterized protein n=1 Tax=Leucosporidium creatinivorum TaxID=106004 RepID=A0A1Y2G4N8_9BASI|nr:hypothetical protein BCR35DRAFT_298471 [Leucosporidium creatinivorum]
MGVHLLHYLSNPQTPSGEVEGPYHPQVDLFVPSHAVYTVSVDSQVLDRALEAYSYIQKLLQARPPADWLERPLLLLRTQSTRFETLQAGCETWLKRIQQELRLEVELAREPTELELAMKQRQLESWTPAEEDSKSWTSKHVGLLLLRMDKRRRDFFDAWKPLLDRIELLEKEEEEQALQQGTSKLHPPRSTSPLNSPTASHRSTTPPSSTPIVLTASGIAPPSSSPPLGIRNRRKLGDEPTLEEGEVRVWSSARGRI